MNTDWESLLVRWTQAGLLSADTAGRIRAWESGRASSPGLAWPIRIAVAFGAILLAAGVLLFVSAHWDELPPAGRMSLLVSTLAVLHIAAAAVARRFEALSIALHTVGSIALGGAIALAGQIFNLDEHWPAAVLLWAAGCALAWLILGHWTQAALCAILFPWWLAGEWEARLSANGSMLPAWTGICALAFVYLAARASATDSPLRKALGWIGGLGLLPATAIVACYGPVHRSFRTPALWPESWPDWLAWIAAILLPLSFALLIDRRRIQWHAAAVLWTVLLAWIASIADARIAIYGWCLIGSVGLAAWGIRDGRAERINLGIAGLAVTVLVFYFSDVMDKLGRSASLIGVGLLFLGGGWMLERMRRHLLRQISTEAL
ncbi:MAG TPA: DUF2157 domain-containing protein [Bryobacteraceae bacterium]|nr:DUF2157 domain-containing protein [Bryobacteraceae bacterium]